MVWDWEPVTGWETPQAKADREERERQAQVARDTAQEIDRFRQRVAPAIEDAQRQDTANEVQKFRGMVDSFRLQKQAEAANTANEIGKFQQMVSGFVGGQEQVQKFRQKVADWSNAPEQRARLNEIGDQQLAQRESNIASLTAFGQNHPERRQEILRGVEPSMQEEVIRRWTPPPVVEPSTAVIGPGGGITGQNIPLGTDFGRADLGPVRHVWGDSPEAQVLRPEFTPQQSGPINPAFNMILGANPTAIPGVSGLINQLPPGIREAANVGAQSVNPLTALFLPQVGLAKTAEAIAAAAGAGGAAELAGAPAGVRTAAELAGGAAPFTGLGNVRVGNLVPSIDTQAAGAGARATLEPFGLRAPEQVTAGRVKPEIGARVRSGGDEGVITSIGKQDAFGNEYANVKFDNGKHARLAVKNLDEPFPGDAFAQANAILAQHYRGGVAKTPEGAANALANLLSTQISNGSAFLPDVAPRFLVDLETLRSLRPLLEASNSYDAQRALSRLDMWEQSMQGPDFEELLKIARGSAEGQGSSVLDTIPAKQPPLAGVTPESGGIPPREPPVGGEPPPGGPPPLSSVADAAEKGPPVEVPFPRPSTLRTVPEIAADVYNSTRNATGALSRVAGKAPPIRGLVQSVNPSALAGEPPAAWVDALGQEGATRLQTALIAHAQKLDMGSSMISAAETGINQRARAVGLSMKDGQLANQNGVLGLLGDVAENPSQYALTPKQRLFLDQVDQLLKEQHGAELAAGVKKGEIFSGEGRYFPRQVTAVGGVEKVGGQVRSTVGAAQPFQKGRIYETMAEGAANGVDYADNIGNVIGARLRAGVKAVTDNEFANIIRPLGRTPPPGANVGEMGTMIPAFGGRIFPRDVARALTEGVQAAPQGGLIGAINSGNSFLRALRATGDLSYSLIQNLTGAATNPAAFAKSIGTGFDSLLLDGRLYGRWVQQNARQIERFVNSGGLMGGSEFTFENILTNRSLSGLLRRGTSRFDNAFNNAANVNALSHFEGLAGVDAAMGPSWFRKAARVVFGDLGAFGRNATSDEIAASLANKIAGRVSSRALGVGAAQREVESLFAFAPRFYRAAFGLLGDAVQGGMRGAEARRTLMLFAGGATAAYVASARALGQEPKLDPSRADFFTVRIGGQNAGFGGPMMGLVRMLGTAASDPARLGDMSITSNPLLKWARGRTAPVLGVAIDIINKKTYIGTPVQTPRQIAEYLATQPLPFTGQALVQEGPQSAATQFTGLRSFPGVSGDFWDIPRWAGIPKDDEGAIFDAMAQARQMYDDIKAQAPNSSVTQLDVARALPSTVEPRIRALTVAVMGNKVKDNPDRINFAIRHQDELNGNALNSVFNAPLARQLFHAGILRRENFQKWQEAQVMP